MSAQRQDNPTLALQEKEAKIRNLTQERNERRMLGMFTGPDRSSAVFRRIQPENQEVQRTMTSIMDGLNETFHAMGHSLARIPSMTGFRPETLELVRRATNDPLMFLGHPVPQRFLCALAAAALCKWIFESDFPRFNGEDSPFVKAMMQVLALQGK